MILSPNGHDSRFLGYLMNDRSIAQQKANFAQGDAVVHISASNLSRIHLRMEAALWPQVRRPGAHGVISHESALALYGLSDTSPSKIHLTLPARLRIRRTPPKHLVLHYADLEPGDLQTIEGVPVTTAARAIRDAHESHLGPARVRQAIEDGRRTGHLTHADADRLEQELLGTKRRPGRAARASRPRA